MTYNYKDQLDTLEKTIKGLKEGAYIRGDCPFCGGRNTFGIGRSGGVVKWGCFRASCSIHGAKDVGYTRAGIKQRLGYDRYIVSSHANSSAAIPSPLVAIDRNADIKEWLHSVNALKAYNDGLVDIRYAPTENRVLFRIPSKEGYVGRALRTKDNPNASFTGPKWKNYGDTSSIFQCGTGTTAVVVEDVASACAVGVLPEFTGVSLLGTKLTQQHKVDLRSFKRVYVCLDPDAAGKSIGFAKRLEGMVPTYVKLIKDDLKYFKPDEIKTMLCGEELAL